MSSGPSGGDQHAGAIVQATDLQRTYYLGEPVHALDGLYPAWHAVRVDRK